MKSKNIVHVISCHAEGEVGDVIVGGVAVPPETHYGSNGILYTKMKSLGILF